MSGDEIVNQIINFCNDNSEIISFVGTLITSALTGVLIYCTNKNVQKTISSNNENIKSEQAFRIKQEEKKILYEALEKISKNLEEDFSNLKIAINNLKVGGINKLDESGGYTKNLVDTKILSRMYFPTLYEKIVEYENIIDSYFLIELSFGYKKSNNQLKISDKDTSEISRINIAYGKIEIYLNNEIDSINRKLNQD